MFLFVSLHPYSLAVQYVVPVKGGRAVGMVHLLVLIQQCPTPRVPKYIHFNVLIISYNV
jgi:hypothetical protein